MANYNANGVIAAITAYMDWAVQKPYANSKFAVLHDANDFRYSKFGKETAVRNIVGGTFSNYDATSGFTRNDGTASTVGWQKFVAPYDRKHVIMIDAITELNAILEGMKPSGGLAYDAVYAREMAEIDATTCATLYSYVTEANKHLNTANGYKTDKENILETLTNLDNELKNKGVYDEVFVFMSNSVYKNLQLALISSYGIANSAILSKTTVTQALSKTGLDITTEVVKFGNRLIIVDVPDDRMNTLVTLYDGVTDGQKQGGWAPDTTSTGSGKVDIIAVPKKASFLDIRHLVSTLSLPVAVDGIASIANKITNAEVAAQLNGLYDGSIAIQRIGVTQDSDAFVYNNRILFGAGVFDVYKDTIIAITGALKS